MPLPRLTPLFRMAVYGSLTIAATTPALATTVAATSPIHSTAGPATSALPATAAPTLNPTQVTRTAAVSASDAWVRWLPGMVPSGGFMTLTNRGQQTIELLGATSPDYGDVMLHQTVQSGSTSSMRMIDRLSLPAGKTIDIVPGGYHFMLSAPTHPIAVGDTVTLLLRFSDDTTLRVPATVSPPTRMR